MHTKLAAVPWYGLAALAGVAAAQPPFGYQSAYADYKSHVEEPLASWREVNDLAARVGGHAGIFGGAAHRGHAGPKTNEAPASPPSAKPPAAAQPAPAHGHH